MASRITYPGAGTLYVIPFDYLDRTHVKVAVDDVDLATDQWSFVTDGTIALNADPGAADVTVYRETPPNPLTVYQSGSVLSRDDLEVDSLQALYRIEEVNDAFPDFPTPVALAPLVWNEDGGLENGSTELTGDMLLRPNLADTTSDFYGAGLIGYRHEQAGATTGTTVLDKLRESLSVLDYMTAAERTAAINRSGTLDHSAAIITAMADAKAAGKRLHFPAGLYIRDVSTLQATFANDESLHIYGDGMGATVIKEADGRTLADGRFTKVLYFLAPDGVTAGNLTVENLTIDKNGASNGAEPSAYAWEQAHCCEINASTTGSFRNVVIRNVDTLDKVGGGVVFAAGRVMQATVENVHGRNFSDLFSQRGDIEFQASIDSLIVRACTGKYVQCEPDDATPSAGILPVANFFDCVYENLDFAGYSGATTSQTVNLTNVKATTMIDVRSVKILADNCYFVVGDGNSEYWSRTANGSTLTDCEIVNKYTSAGDTIAPFYPKHESTGSGTYLDLVRCKFVPGTGASSTTTGYAIAQTTVYNPATGIPYKVRFVECEFSPLYQHLGDFYRAGVFEFIRCELACRSHAFRVGRDATYVTRLTIDDCDTSAVTGGIVVRYVGLTPGPTLTIRGSHDLFYWVWGSDVSITGVDDSTKFVGIFTSDTAPTGGGVAGQRVRINAPAVGMPSEYVCTTSHLTLATWKPVTWVEMAGSKAFDWASLATGTSQTTTVTVTGAAVGDYVKAEMNVSLGGSKLDAEVTAANTVTVTQRNDTGAAVDVASGTLLVTGRKP